MNERLALLAAYEQGIVHLLARAELHAKTVPNANIFRQSIKKFLVEGIYQTLVVNTRPASADFNLPLDTLLEFRMVYEV